MRTHQSVVALVLAGAACVTASCSSDVPTNTNGSDVPTYVTTEYFRGLDETVRIVKSPYELYAIRADGTRVGYLALFDLERAAFAQRFGSFTPEVQQRVNDGAPSLHVAVTFPIAIDWPSISVAMNGDDGLLRENAKATLTSQVALGADVWRTKLEAVGMRVTLVGESMPIIFGVIGSAGLATLRPLSGIRVWLDEQGQVTNDSPHIDLVDSHIDVAYQQPNPPPVGNYAGLQRIGILEVMGYNRIFPASPVA